MTAAAPLLTRADLAILGRLSLDSLDALLTGSAASARAQAARPASSSSTTGGTCRATTSAGSTGTSMPGCASCTSAPRRARRASRSPSSSTRVARCNADRRLACDTRGGWRRCSAPWPCFTATRCRCTCSATVTPSPAGSTTAPRRSCAWRDELETLRVGTTTDLAASVRRAREASGQAGLAVLITDMLVPADARRLALRELGRETRSVALLHVIADDAAVGATRRRTSDRQRDRRRPRGDPRRGGSAALRRAAGPVPRDRRRGVPARGRPLSPGARQRRPARSACSTTPAPRRW